MTTTASAIASPLARRRILPGGRLLFFAAVCFLLRVATAQALPPQQMLMDPPTAVVQQGMLSLRLALAVDDEEGLHALLKDGAVLELAVSVSVERERSFWANAEAATASFSSILRHDPLTRDFIALVPTLEGEKEFRDRNLGRLLQATWRNLTLPVAPLDDILREQPAERYLFSLSARLRHTEVPPWLEKSSVFWSTEVVPQEKRTFVFVPPPGVR